MLDRWAIDDGRHLPSFDDDIVSSVERGQEMVVVSCSCGRMAAVSVPADQRLVPHLAHLDLSQQIKGAPGREGLRLFLLGLADLLLVMGSIAVGDQVLPHPVGIAEVAARVGFVFVGFAAAAGLTVMLRHTIAPGRLPRPPKS